MIHASAQLAIRVDNRPESARAYGVEYGHDSHGHFENKVTSI